MTKRKVLYYLIILAFIGWSGPFLMGIYLETQYESFLERASEFEGSNLTPLEYKRHWDHSIAKTQVVVNYSAWKKMVSRWHYPLKTTAEKVPPLVFVLEHKIHHGPWIKRGGWTDWQLARATIESSLLLTEEAAQVIEAETGVTELLNFKAVIGLIDGMMSVKLDGDGFKTQDQKEGEPQAWGGVKGTWSINQSFDEIETSLLFPGYYFDINQSRYQGQDLSFESRRTRTEDGLWKGSSLLKAQRLFFDDMDDADRIEINGLNLSTSVEEREERFDNTFYVQADKVTFNEQLLGPLSLGVSARHIPKEVLSLVRKLSANAPSDATLDYYLLNKDLVSFLPELLASKPEIIVTNFQLGTQEGPFKADFYFTVGSENALNPGDIPAVVNTIKSRLKIKVPDSVMREYLSYLVSNESPEYNLEQVQLGVEGKLATLRRQRLIQEKQGLVEADLEFLSSQLRSFGTPIDFPKSLLD